MLFPHQPGNVSTNAIGAVAPVSGTAGRQQDSVGIVVWLTCARARRHPTSNGGIMKRTVDVRRRQRDGRAARRGVHAAMAIAMLVSQQLWACEPGRWRNPASFAARPCQ